MVSASASLATPKILRVAGSFHYSDSSAKMKTWKAAAAAARMRPAMIMC
jgi:hypothetical protein